MEQTSKLKKKIIEIYLKNRVVFVVQFLFGILIHFYVLSNLLDNHDSIVHPANNFDWLLVQGKWLVTPLASMEGLLDLNYLAQIICLLSISLASIVIAEMFKLESPRTVILIGLIFISFPSVATMAVYHAGDYFGTVWLMAIISAYFISLQNFFSSIIGIVLLVLSIGGYQPYMGFTISLLSLDCLFRLLQNEEVIQVIKRGILYIGEIIFSIGMYYIILQILLENSGKTLSAYKGMDSVESNLRLSEIMKSIVGLFKDVFGFLFDGHIDIDRGAIKPYYFAIIVTLLFGVVMAAYHYRINRSIVRMIGVVFILFICIPFGTNITGLFVSNKSFYFNTIAPLSIIFIIPLILSYLLSKVTSPSERELKLYKLYNVATIITSLLLVWRWAIQDNVIYQKLEILNNSYDIKLSTLAERINESTAYESDIPIVMVGEPPYRFLKATGKLAAFESNYDTSRAGISNNAELLLYSNRIIAHYLRNKLSIELNVLYDQIEFIDAHRQLIESMPTYPKKGFAKIVDGILLVKISDTIKEEAQ